MPCSDAEGGLHVHVLPVSRRHAHRTLSLLSGLSSSSLKCTATRRRSSGERAGAGARQCGIVNAVPRRARVEGAIFESRVLNLGAFHRWLAGYS